MASLSQVASQYVFLLFGATGIGATRSNWVLLGGIIWIVLMTAICYVGIEVSAGLPEGPAVLELIDACRSVGRGAGQGRQRQRSGRDLAPNISWLNPFDIGAFSAFSAASS